MMKEEIITSKTQALNSMKKIMGERVKLIIREGHETLGSDPNVVNLMST